MCTCLQGKERIHAVQSAHASMEWQKELAMAYNLYQSLWLSLLSSHWSCCGIAPRRDSKCNALMCGLLLCMNWCSSELAPCHHDNRISAASISTKWQTPVSALAAANFWRPAAIVQSIGFHLSDRPEAQADSFLSFLTTRWSLPSMDSLNYPVHIPQSTGGKFRRLCMNVMSAVVNCNQDHDAFENAYHIILDWNMLLWLLYHQYLKEEGKRRAEGLQLFLELKKYQKPLWLSQLFHFTNKYGWSKQHKAMEYRCYLLEISKGSLVTGLCDALHGLHLRSCVLQGQLATNNGLHFVRSAITQMNYMYAGAPYWSSTVKTLLGDPHQTGHLFFKGSSFGTHASAQTIVKVAHLFPWLFLTFPWNFGQSTHTYFCVPGYRNLQRKTTNTACRLHWYLVN